MANNQSQIPAPVQAKLRSLQEAMKRDGLSALLFYSSGQLSMLEVNPVLWMSGVLPMGPNAGVLLTDSCDATMLISLSWDQGRVRRQTWIHEVRVAERFADAVQELVQQQSVMGLYAGRALPVSATSVGWKSRGSGSHPQHPRPLSRPGIPSRATARSRTCRQRFFRHLAKGENRHAGIRAGSGG